MTQHGFKETGVVNIAEPVMFELAGQEETKDQQSTKGVGNLLNMDTFSALRQLRNKVTAGDITEEEYQAERFKLLGKAAPEGGPGSFPCCVRGATARGSLSIRNSSRTFGLGTRVQGFVGKEPRGLILGRVRSFLLRCRAGRLVQRPGSIRIVDE